MTHVEMGLITLAVAVAMLAVYAVVLHLLLRETTGELAEHLANLREDERRSAKHAETLVRFIRDNNRPQRAS